jgi:uncharacterized membrane protein HdeD (DUF308 family)
VIVGVALVVSAAIEAVELARHGIRGLRVDRLISFAALAAAGVVVLAWPTITQLALLYAVGASAVSLGVAEGSALTAQSHTGRDRWIGALSSIAAFTFGIAMLARPSGGLDVVINLVGFYLVVMGSLRVLQARVANPGPPLNRALG